MRYDADNFNPNKKLKEVREKRLHMTQPEFASAIGIDTDKLQRTENRKNRTGISILEYLKWCDNLDCDIDFLLGVQKLPKREDADINKLTGLEQHTINLLKAEGTSRSRMAVGFTSVRTADLFNILAGEGRVLKEAMGQYIMETQISDLLEQAMPEMVGKYNDRNGLNQSVDSTVAHARITMAGVRRMAALSSLKMAGKKQTRIDDDFTGFYTKMKKEGYTKEECRMLFDLIQSQSRKESLKLECYNQLVQVLDSFASDDDYQLKFNSPLGEFVVSPAIESDDADSGKGKTSAQLDGWKNNRRVEKLEQKLKETEQAYDGLIETNNSLSKELNEVRWKNKELQDELDRIKNNQ